MGGVHSIIRRMGWIFAVLKCASSVPEAQVSCVPPCSTSDVALLRSSDVAMVPIVMEVWEGDGQPKSLCSQVTLPSPSCSYSILLHAPLAAPLKPR